MDKRCLDVYRAVDYLEEVMGTVWLKESLERIKGSSGGGGAFGRGIDLSSCAVSAAAYHWYRAREEMALAGIGGRGPGLYALQAAVLGDDLMALRGSEGLPSRVEGLKSPAEAEDVIAELAIASGYARSGRQLVFNNDGGAFRVLEPEIRVLSVYHHRYRGCGDGRTDRMECSTVEIPGHRRETGLAVIYRYERERGLNLDSRQIHGWPAGSGCAVAGFPVVHCSFTARQGCRGPEMIRTGWTTGGGRQYLPDYIHIPNEIIMPVR